MWISFYNFVRSKRLFGVFGDRAFSSSHAFFYKSLMSGNLVGTEYMFMRRVLLSSLSFFIIMMASASMVADISLIVLETTKCEKPTINYRNGKLTFSCATDDVTFHYTITDSNNNSGTGNEVSLNTFNVSVYATKEGYEDSEVATMVISTGANGIIGDVNGDGKITVADAVVIVDLTLSGSGDQGDQGESTQNDIAALEDALGKLDGRVAILETTVAGHTDSITNLRKDLTVLTKRLRQNEIDINSLEVYYQRLAHRVSDMENYVKTMEVGVIVQGTYDPVLGSADGFIIDQKTLCGFVGKNGTGITEFPEIGGDSDINGVALDADEVPAEFLEFNPDNKYLNEYVKLGSVYLTPNPIGADATKVNFALLNTVGEATGAEFGTPVPNTTVLTKGILNRYKDISDYVSYNEFPVVWEVPVQMATTGEDFDENLFDYLNFGGEGAKCGKWNLGNLAASFQQVWQGLTADDGTTRYEKGAKAKSEINKIFAAIKEGIDLKYSELNNYGVFVTNPESGRSLFSEANIISVAMEPISYKTAKLFDEAGIHWDLTDLKAQVKYYVQKIQNKSPKANINKIQLSRTGTGIVISIDTDSPEEGVEGQHYEFTYTTGGASTITDEQLARYSELFTGLLAKYRYLTGFDASEMNPIVDNLVNRAQNYLNLMTGEFVNVYYNGHVAITCVEPMLVTEATNASGVTGIVELKDASYGLPNRCTAGTYLFGLTSLLQDYMVPVYKKYIGVVQDGKLIDGNYKIADGDKQVFALTIPEGESIIVVQTLDYAGNTFTKKYLMKATAE